MMDACNLPSCYSCNRIDSDTLNENSSSLVTYVDEYAVVTTSCPEFDSQPAYMAYSLGYCEVENAYITMVVYLGDKNATLKQSYQLVEDDDFYRYWVRHNEFDNLEEAHDMVVTSLKDGLIDVSQGRGKEFFAERDENLLNMKAATALSTGQEWDGKL